MHSFFHVCRPLLFQKSALHWSLAGKTVVFTGTLSLKRSDATTMAINAGAKVTGSISGNTDIVVAGPGAGSKLDGAKAKKVRVMSEAEFIAAATGGGGGGGGAPRAPAPSSLSKNAPGATGGNGILEADGKKWSAYMEQKDDEDTSRFYSIELHEFNGRYAVQTRYGRIGTDGQGPNEACANIGAAMASFRKKFKEMSGNLWDSPEMKPINGKYRVVRIGGAAVAGGGGDDGETSTDDEKCTSAKTKKIKAAAAADKKVVLGAIAAPVIVAVTAKPKWREKLESTKIVATWKKEYLAAVKGTVPESSAEKLFNAAMELLKKMAEGKDDGSDGSDDESMLSYDAQLTGWALDVSRDADGLGLSCSCHPTCTMCFQGRWPDVDDEDAMDPEFNDAVKEYNGPKNVKSFVAWLKTRCKCLPDCEARLKAIRREYLEKHTRCEMNLVPEDLRRSLLALVAPMEKVPASELDWHPGSNEQVLDLVHPSLYCNVRGLTKVTGGGNAEEVTSRRGAAKRVGESSENDEGDASNSCEKHEAPPLFSWIPTDFDITYDPKTKKFTAKNKSYINNIEDPVLTSLLANILSLMIPSFEAVISHHVDFGKELLKSYQASEAKVETPKGSRELYDFWDNERLWPSIASNALSTATTGANTGLGGDLSTLFVRSVNAEIDKMFQLYTAARTAQLNEVKEKFAKTVPGRMPWEIKDSTIQVITKLANVVLTPEKPSYDGGVWHLEGIPQEKIVATAIYYYQTENITDPELNFRFAMKAPPVPQDGDDWVKVHYGFDVRDVAGECAFGGQAPLGSITTKQGLCLFFPNCFQHKIGPMKLIDPTKAGVRKILVFFLVDYRKGAKDRIPSTSDITNQRHDGTMTLLEAKGFRELLMHERKFLVKDEDAFFERMFSLCEH
jgi:hypothetical protein